MRGYAQRAAYLKEHMDAPKFAASNARAHEELIASFEPQEMLLLPSAEFALDSLAPAQIMALIGTVTLLPLRWEPRNNIANHAAIPRPGGGDQCTQLYLNIRNPAGQTEHFRYECNSHALIRVGSSMAGGDTAPSLSIVADGSQIARGYGEFSLSLGILEGGHCAGQIASLFSALNLPIVWADEPPAMAQNGWRGVHLATLALPLDGWHRAVTELTLRPIMARRERPALAWQDRFPSLARAESLCASGSCHFDTPLATAITIDQLRASAWARSSGLQGDGYAPRDRFRPSDLAYLLETWRSFAAATGSGQKLSIRSHLIALAVDGCTSRVARIDLGDGLVDWTDLPDAASQLKPHVGLGFGYNLEAFTCVLVLTAPVARLIDTGGPRRYVDMLAQAGAIGQAFCNAAGLAGLFARPYRAFAEAEIERILKVEDQAIYMILCGHERIANPALPLSHFAEVSASGTSGKA